MMEVILFLLHFHPFHPSVFTSSKTEYIFTTFFLGHIYLKIVYLHRYHLVLFRVLISVLSNKVKTSKLLFVCCFCKQYKAHAWNIVWQQNKCSVSWSIKMSSVFFFEIHVKTCQDTWYKLLYLKMIYYEIPFLLKIDIM